MINVLQLHSSSGLYGAESVILNLTKALKFHKYHSIIGTIEVDRNNLSEFAYAALERGMDVEILITKVKFSPNAIIKLVRLIKTRNVKIIHSHYSKATIIGFFASKIAGIPLIETNHLFPPMPLSDKKLQLYARIGAFFLRFTNKTIAVSHKIKQSLKEAGVPENTIDVIANGIDIDECLVVKSNERILIRRELGLKENNIVIGGVGRLTEQKGFEYLLKAAKIVTLKHKNSRFIIAGDGLLRGQLNKYIQKYKLEDYVKLLGFRKDILRILSAMDIFVMPSIDEGLPIAMLEAMAVGVPVIVSAVGEIPRVIINGENGILIEPKNSDELANKINFLIENEKNQRDITDNGLKIVKTKYSNEAMSLSYARTYNSLLKLS